MKTEHIMKAIRAVERQVQCPIRRPLVGVDGGVIHVATWNAYLAEMYHIERIDTCCPVIELRARDASMDCLLSGGVEYQKIFLDNPSRDEMNEIMTTYAASQGRWCATNQIGIDSYVTVMTSCASRQWGWETRWDRLMDECIGVTCRVEEISERRGFLLGRWWFPYFVLEPAC